MIYLTINKELKKNRRSNQAWDVSVRKEGIKSMLCEWRVCVWRCCKVHQIIRSWIKAATSPECLMSAGREGETGQLLTAGRHMAQVLPVALIGPPCCKQALLCYAS